MLHGTHDAWPGLGCDDPAAHGCSVPLMQLEPAGQMVIAVAPINIVVLVVPVDAPYTDEYET